MIGQGAGGFPLVHLEERRASDNALNTRESHGVVLRVLSGLGLVGLAMLLALIAAVVVGRPAGRRGPSRSRPRHTARDPRRLRAPGRR